MRECFSAARDAEESTHGLLLGIQSGEVDFSQLGHSDFFCVELETNAAKSSQIPGDICMRTGCSNLFLNFPSASHRIGCQVGKVLVSFGASSRPSGSSSCGARELFAQSSGSIVTVPECALVCGSLQSSSTSILTYGSFVRSFKRMITERDN